MRLVTTLKKFYAANGRDHLPWRGTHDPYKVLVSEVMLQQTQVDRVIPFYNRFITRFPTVEALASASLTDVLASWSGLGYNRRAKYLHEAAKTVIREHRGAFPRTAAALEKLPGVGPYTTRAIAAFAYNEPGIFIETNIRTVFTHSYFPTCEKVSDAELLPLIARDLARSRMAPREFYAALMDYGAHLKRSGVRINSRSAHYARQSTFKGSARQLRGVLLREILGSPTTAAKLQKRSGRPLAEVMTELARLKKEGLVVRRKTKFAIAK